jgi:integrase
MPHFRTLLMATPTPPKRLTQAAVDALPPTGKKYRQADNQVKGLFVRVTAAGHKAYEVRRRIPGGRGRVEYTIADAADITLQEARRRAGIELAKIGDGRNPLEERREAEKEEKARNANTLSGLIDLYRNSSDYRELKQSTRELYDQYLNTYITEEWGETPYADIKRGRVAEWVDRLRYERSPNVATSARSILSGVCTFAVSRDLLEYNPVQGVKLPKGSKGKRDRVLSDTELVALWEAIDAQDCMKQTAADMLRFLMLVPPRRGEVAGMRWDEVDLSEGLLVVPSERMKGNRQHDLPLNASAVDLLKERKERLEKEAKEAGRELLPWVFPNANGDGPMEGKRVKRVCDRLRDKWHKEREEAEGREIEKTKAQNFGPHDIRRTITTRLMALSANRGFHPAHVERLLSHAVNSGKAISHYDHYDYMAEKRTLVDIWETELLRIVGGAEPPENVLPLRPVNAAN